MLADALLAPERFGGFHLLQGPPFAAEPFASSRLAVFPPSSQVFALYTRVF
jgi:hypothetical protein